MRVEDIITARWEINQEWDVQQAHTGVMIRQEYENANVWLYFVE